MSGLTQRERDRVIEAAHPSRPDREELVDAAVEAVIAARLTGMSGDTGDAETRGRLADALAASGAFGTLPLNPDQARMVMHATDAALPLLAAERARGAAESVQAVRDASLWENNLVAVRAEAALVDLDYAGSAFTDDEIDDYRGGFGTGVRDSAAALRAVLPPESEDRRCDWCSGTGYSGPEMCNQCNGSGRAVLPPESEGQR